MGERAWGMGGMACIEPSQLPDLCQKCPGLPVPPHATAPTSLLSILPCSWARRARWSALFPWQCWFWCRVVGREMTSGKWKESGAVGVALHWTLCLPVCTPYVCQYVPGCERQGMPSEPSPTHTARPVRSSSPPSLPPGRDAARADPRFQSLCPRALIPAKQPHHLLEGQPTRRSLSGAAAVEVMQKPTHPHTQT